MQPQGKAEKVLPGRVHQKIACRNYPAYSYALYLPSDYSASDSLPVFLAFDPMGSGEMPVEKYKELAEKYRFILIGSNDSRNGQVYEVQEQVIYALFDELRSRYHYSASRTYCMGFSGGARTAGYVSFYRGGVRGMIGCGAGLPAFDAPLRKRADHFGLVGNKDFNYPEMIDLYGNFDNLGYLHDLRIFSGIHAWPPPEILEEGIRWHYASAMKEGLMPVADSIIRSAKQASDANRHICEGILPGSMAKECNLQQQYLQAFSDKNAGWWQLRIKKLNAGTTSADSLESYRLLSYLGIACWSVANQALIAKDRGRLEQAIIVYELVEPGNPYIAELKEKLKILP
jgi:predicted esterase